jgi:uncharacterized membrane protein YiaA
LNPREDGDVFSFEEDKSPPQNEDMACLHLSEQLKYEEIIDPKKKIEKHQSFKTKQVKSVIINYSMIEIFLFSISTSRTENHLAMMGFFVSLFLRPINQF